METQTILTIVLLSTLVALAVAIHTLIKPIKTLLCEKKICGVIVPANSVIPVYKGKSVLHWALPFGLKMVGGKLLENKDSNGNDLPPGNSGDEIGVWWEGWTAWFRGIRFPKIKEGLDSKGKKVMVPANDLAIVIQKIRKIPKVDPSLPIDQQFERQTEAIDHLKRNINRFIILNGVELKDGSTVTLSTYAVGGVVEDPYKFWIKHGKDAFGIWESETDTSVSECLQPKTFEEFFREGANPYKTLENWLEDINHIPKLDAIGVINCEWEMDKWEDTSSPEIRKARAELPNILATAKTAQERAKQDTITAHEQAKTKVAQQKVAEEELKRRLQLAGQSSDAKELAALMALAEDAGATGSKIIEKWFDVKERAATPVLTTLVESGAQTSTQVQVKGGN